MHKIKNFITRPLFSLKRIVMLRVEYTYFIAYAKPEGVGRCFVKRDTPIRTRGDIEAVEKEIKRKYQLDNLVINNFIRIRGEVT